MDDIISSPGKQKRYKKETIGNKEISNSVYRQTLLLHCCCAPCASYVLKYLESSYDITLFFYNPNIEPESEYIKRKTELEKLKVMQYLHSGIDVKIVESEYNSDIFNDLVSALQDEPEGGARCKMCFDIRLSETAKMAKLHNFDIFATTLSVSPHKNAININDSGNRQSSEHNIFYLSEDFKKKDGYTHSVELSKKYGLYRQNYCGCKYSNRKVNT